MNDRVLRVSGVDPLRHHNSSSTNFLSGNYNNMSASVGHTGARAIVKGSDVLVHGQQLVIYLRDKQGILAR